MGLLIALSSINNKTTYRVRYGTYFSRVHFRAGKGSESSFMPGRVFDRIVRITALRCSWSGVVYKENYNQGFTREYWQQLLTMTVAAEQSCISEVTDKSWIVHSKTIGVQSTDISHSAVTRTHPNYKDSEKTRSRTSKRRFKGFRSSEQRFKVTDLMISNLSALLTKSILMLKTSIKKIYFIIIY